MSSENLSLVLNVDIDPSMGTPQPPPRQNRGRKSKSTVKQSKVYQPKTINNRNVGSNITANRTNNSSTISMIKSPKPPSRKGKSPTSTPKATTTIRPSNQLTLSSNSSTKLTTTWNQLGKSNQQKAKNGPNNQPKVNNKSINRQLLTNKGLTEDGDGQLMDKSNGQQGTSCDQVNENSNITNGQENCVTLSRKMGEAKKDNHQSIDNSTCNIQPSIQLEVKLLVEQSSELSSPSSSSSLLSSSSSLERVGGGRKGGQEEEEKVTTEREKSKVQRGKKRKDDDVQLIDKRETNQLSLNLIDCQPSTSTNYQNREVATAKQSTGLTINNKNNNRQKQKSSDKLPLVVNQKMNKLSTEVKFTDQVGQSSSSLPFGPEVLHVNRSVRQSPSNPFHGQSTNCDNQLVDNLIEPITSKLSSGYSDLRNNNYNKQTIGGIKSQPFKPVNGNKESGFSSSTYNCGNLSSSSSSCSSSSSSSTWNKKISLVEKSIREKDKLTNNCIDKVSSFSENNCLVFNSSDGYLDVQQSNHQQLIYCDNNDVDNDDDDDDGQRNLVNQSKYLNDDKNSNCLEKEEKTKQFSRKKKLLSQENNSSVVPLKELNNLSPSEDSFSNKNLPESDNNQCKDREKFKNCKYTKNNQPSDLLNDNQSTSDCVHVDISTLTTVNNKLDNNNTQEKKNGQTEQQSPLNGTQSTTAIISSPSSSTTTTTNSPSRNKFYSIGSQLPKTTVKSVKRIGVFYSDLCDVIKGMRTSGQNQSNHHYHQQQPSHNVHQQQQQHHHHHHHNPQQQLNSSYNNNNINHQLTNDGNHSVNNGNVVTNNNGFNVSNETTDDGDENGDHNNGQHNQQQQHQHDQQNISTLMITGDTSIETTNGSSQGSPIYRPPPLMDSSNLPDILNSHLPPPPPYSTLPPPGHPSIIYPRSPLLSHNNNNNNTLISATQSSCNPSGQPGHHHSQPLSCSSSINPSSTPFLPTISSYSMTQSPLGLNTVPSSHPLPPSSGQPVSPGRPLLPSRRNYAPIVASGGNNGTNGISASTAAALSSSFSNNNYLSSTSTSNLPHSAPSGSSSTSTPHPSPPTVSLPPPHSSSHHHHHHHHHTSHPSNHRHHHPYLRSGCSRDSDAETSTTKSCFNCTRFTLKWTLLTISFIGVIFTIVGTFLGSSDRVGRENLTVSLTMICIGIVLVVISGLTWKAINTGSEWRSLFGLDEIPGIVGTSGSSLESTGRRFLPRVPDPHGRSGAHHHPYGAMFYPEFQYRPPPPSYQASMQEYRLRLLLLERSSSHTQPTSLSPVSPPPTYRSSAASSLAGTLNRPGGNTLTRPISRPPSYRSIIDQNSVNNNNNSSLSGQLNSSGNNNNNSLGHPIYSSSRLITTTTSTNASQQSQEPITSTGGLNSTIPTTNSTTNTTTTSNYKDDVNRITIHQTNTTSTVCTPNGINIVAITPMTNESNDETTDRNNTINANMLSNTNSSSTTSLSAVTLTSNSENLLTPAFNSGPNPSISTSGNSEVQILAHV